VINLATRQNAAIVSSRVAGRLMICWTASGGARRALVIVIDEYTTAEHSSPGSRWRNLKGAVNDAEAMASLLVARYDFERSDVRLLRNGAATRTAILEGLAEMAETSESGDVAVFFYAGHGSQRRSTSSSERDLLDETIVPADSNRGAQDIRDKTLRAAFNRVLDRDSKLVAFFDSCSSGSITRSLRLTARYLQPAETDSQSSPASTPVDAGPPPEQRGGIVLSAAVDGREAHETIDDEGRPRGAFSLALARALRQAPLDESAERIFRRVRASLQASAISQDPVLAGRDGARRSPLFGELSASGPRSTMAAVVAVEDGFVRLDAGIAAGLNPGAELLSERETAVPIRLRIAEVIGMAHSNAEIVAGDASVLVPGDLFRLDRWTAPRGADLRLSIPESVRRERVSAMSETLEFLRAAGHIELVEEDPGPSGASHRVAWKHGSWWLETAPDSRRSLGPSVDPDDLRTSLGETSEPVKLYVSLPPIDGIREHLVSFIEGSRGSLSLVDERHADYVLSGSTQSQQVSYAWVRPGTQKEHGLPPRSEWIRVGADKEHPSVTASSLASVLDPLAKIRAWLNLETPPHDERYPYHLTLVGVDSGRRVTGGAVFEGDVYQLSLERADDGPTRNMTRRYVYVFAIDSFGQRQLLYPLSSSGSGENLLPATWTADGSPSSSMRLGEPFAISPPFGTDSFVMLTTAEPLADPRVLEGAAVRTRRPGLDAVLATIGSYGRGKPVPTHTNWSVRRIVVRTVAR